MPDEFDETMPPEPNAASAASENVTVTHVCPSCGRKLLSISSKFCNWCGAEIKDAAYQEHAAEERAEFDQNEKLQLVVEEEKGRLIQRMSGRGLI